MKYRYTKFTGDLIDELDLEDLVSKLSDLLLSSGFANPHGTDDSERTMQALHDAILDALFNGGVLPEETIVAEPFAEDAFGLDGAVFTAEPDPETNFKLFGLVPSQSAGAATTSRAFALRLRPNQDFAGALETFCRARGIFRARLHGGVGSTIGARFADGRSVVPFATELAVSSGFIAAGANGTLEAALDIALVDYLGGLAEGRLVRGDNPVLMTMELVLEVLDADVP